MNTKRNLQDDLRGREARRRRERGAEVTPASGRSETGANAEKGQSARRKEPVEEP